MVHLGPTFWNISQNRQCVALFVVHISSVHGHEYSSTRFCVSEVKQFSTAF